MTYTPLALVWSILALCVLFGAVIYFGLRTRRTQMTANLSMRAQDIWAPFAHCGWDFDSLLYGIRQDFSATQIGMIVRDFRDEEVGRITFHTAARRGATTFATSNGSFEADVLPTFRRRVVLLDATNEHEALCTFSGRMWGPLRFALAGTETIEGTVDGRLRLAPRFAFSLAGKRIGLSQQIGGAVNRGVLLTIPSTIPVHVRMFMLAMLA